jgi:hypothetical protein
MFFFQVEIAGPLFWREKKLYGRNRKKSSGSDARA